MISERVLTPVLLPSGDAAMALVWTTASVPADNNDPMGGAERDAGVTSEERLGAADRGEWTDRA